MKSTQLRIKNIWLRRELISNFINYILGIKDILWYFAGVLRKGCEVVMLLNMEISEVNADNPCVLEKRKFLP